MSRQLVVAMFLACGCAVPSTPGPVSSDASAGDAGADGARDGGTDAGPRDAGPRDAGPRDAGRRDAGISDACVAQAERCDGDDDDCDGRIDELGADCELPFATVECIAAACTIAACFPLHGDCDGAAANGCETPLDTLSNCGGCALACTSPSGTPTCAGGSCAIESCAPGLADCRGGAADGCESSTHTLTDCGACGRACAPAHATPACDEGTCRILDCDSGFADCNGVETDGCEASLATDATCGACDVACGAVASGTSGCMVGACVVAACEALRADCDRDVGNGCETSLLEPTSCGACGVQCGTGMACRAGLCVATRTSPTISAGDRHTCVLREDGRVWCWGDNEQGELGRGTRSSRITDIYPTPQALPLADVFALSETSVRASCAIDRSGRVACWGEISGGAGAPGPTLWPVFASGITGARAVGVGQVACVALANGRVRCWGFDHFGTGPILDHPLREANSPRAPALGLYDAETVIAGSGVLVCATRRSGFVSCWGVSGWTGTGSTATSPTTPRTVIALEDVVSLDAGYGHTCAVVADGRVACWGSNGGISGMNTERVGDLAPGSVSGAPGWIVGVDDAVEVTAGGDHTCIRRRDGRVSCWGASYEGQLGNGTYATSRTAVDVTGITDAVEIDAGGQHTCAIRADRSVWCWGSNGSAQIGRPTRERCRPRVDSWECPDAPVPVQVMGLPAR